MHDGIKRMLKRYPLSNSFECTQALREIMQSIVLLGLWRSKFFEEAAFYGGTALRILYGLDRYSEDLDFSLLKPSKDFSLSRYHAGIQREMEAFGFSIQVIKKNKSWENPVQSAFVKTKTHYELIRIGVEPFSFKGLHPETILKVKIEIDTDPPKGAQTQSSPINDPIPVMIKSYCLSDLFAGKMHAVLCRAWENRVKGRDWYDFVWFASQNIPLNLSHLESRMRQSGHLDQEEQLSGSLFKELLENKISNLDIESAMRDVKPFLRDSAILDSWSRDYFLHYTQFVGFSK